MEFHPLHHLHQGRYLHFYQKMIAGFINIRQIKNAASTVS